MEQPQSHSRTVQASKPSQFPLFHDPCSRRHHVTEAIAALSQRTASSSASAFNTSSGRFGSRLGACLVSPFPLSSEAEERGIRIGVFRFCAPKARSFCQREAWYYFRVRSTGLLPNRVSGTSNKFSAKRYNCPGADLRARGTLERTRGWTARPALEKKRRQTRAQVVRGPPGKTPE